MLLDVSNIQPKSQTLKVVCIGDSITEGYRSTDGNNYPKYLDEILSLNMPD